MSDGPVGWDGQSEAGKMESGDKALGWLRNTSLGVFIAALLGGMLLPVYTDEVGWRLHERAAFDGVDKLFTMLCGPTSVVQPPFWMMPVRYYSALFNSLFADPFYVRLSGVLYALAWTAMLLALIRRVAGSPVDRIALTSLSVGFLSLGTLPLLLVWSRPEQPIILALTGAVLIASGDWRREGPDTSAKTAWLRGLAILTLAAVAMSYHGKGLVTVPLFLVCILMAPRGRQAVLPRTIMALLLMALAASATFYWLDRMHCPNIPAARADFLRYNSGAAMAGATSLGQLENLIGQALGNISVLHYLGLAAPRAEPMSFWLAPYRISLANSFAWFLVIIGIWLCGLTAAACCLVGSARRMWRERTLDSRTVLSAALVVTVLGWSATQGVRNDYEAIFVVPMMVLAVMLALTAHGESKWLVTGFRVVSVSVALLGIVSVGLVAALYGPTLVEASHERGYLKVQRLSVSPFGYADLRRDILKVADKCGISDPDNNHALLIDDVTYFAFMKSRMPEHSGGLITIWNATDDPIAYLRGIKSDGVVLSCHRLPQELRARAKREGQFCCLAPPNW